jgi:thioester reductase-like protein
MEQQPAIQKTLPNEDLELESPHSTLRGVLQWWAKTEPNRRAFTFIDEDGSETSLTYGQFQERAQAIGAHLQKITRPGDRVIVLFPPGLDFITGLFGCFYAGVTAVPLYPPEPARLKQTLPRLEKTAKDAQSQVILCNQRVHSKKILLAMIARGLRGFQWVNSSKISPKLAKKWKEPPAQPDELALLMYTSGSTGFPKGVMLSQRNLVLDLRCYELMMQKYHAPKPEDGAFNWVPPYHITGLMMGILFPVYYGMPTHFMSPLDFLSQPKRWLESMSLSKASSSGGPNFSYEMCVRQIRPEEIKSLDLSHWALAMCGGEAVRPETFQRFTKTFAPAGFDPKAFCPGYGLTEAGMLVSIDLPSKLTTTLHLHTKALKQFRVEEVEESNPSARTILSCGIPTIGKQILIVDPENNTPCPPNRIGEIWVSSSSVAQGYWNNDEASRKTFQGFLADTGAGPYLRTGDLGFLHQGELFITGRYKEMIIIRGVNFYPEDIELAVREADPVLTSGRQAAFGIENNNEEALVVIAECENLKKDQYKNTIQNIVNEISGRHQIKPSSVVLIKMGTLPQTPSRKVARYDCREDFLAGKLSILSQWQKLPPQVAKAKTEAEAPPKKPKNEKQLADWLGYQIAQALGVDPEKIDNQKSLGHYGLDSLAAVDISRSVEETLGIPLRITTIFDTETIGDFIQEITDLWKEQRARGPLAKKKLDLRQEARLDSSIKFDAPPASGEEAKHIFMTGGTGFLGAFFIHEIMKNTQAKLYCLVRAENEKEGKKRLMDNLEYFSLMSPDLESRLIPIPGDLSKPLLGLSQPAFDQLAEKIDTVYHFGAVLNFIYSYWDLKPANVLGTQEVIRFAAHRTTKKVHYISTRGVFPTLGNKELKTFREDDSLEITEGLINGYAQSKWVAEKMMREASQRGLPVSIYRVGDVIGHSRSGLCRPEKDAYCNMVRAGLWLGSAPKVKIVMYPVPVDYVASAILYLSRQNNALGQTFHLTGDPLDFQEILQLIPSLGYDLKIIEFDEWLTSLDKELGGLSRSALMGLMPFLKDPLLKESALEPLKAKIENTKTAKSLAGGPVEYPPIRDAIKAYLDFLRESHFLSKE